MLIFFSFSFPPPAPNLCKPHRPGLRFRPIRRSDQCCGCRQDTTGPDPVIPHSVLQDMAGGLVEVCCLGVHVKFFFFATRVLTCRWPALVSQFPLRYSNTFFSVPDGRVAQNCQTEYFQFYPKKVWLRMQLRYRPLNALAMHRARGRRFCILVFLILANFSGFFPFCFFSRVLLENGFDSKILHCPEHHCSRFIQPRHGMGVRCQEQPKMACPLPKAPDPKPQKKFFCVLVKVY